MSISFVDTLQDSNFAFVIFVIKCGYKSCCRGQWPCSEATCASHCCVTAVNVRGSDEQLESSQCGFKGQLLL